MTALSSAEVRHLYYRPRANVLEALQIDEPKYGRKDVPQFEIQQGGDRPGIDHGTLAVATAGADCPEYHLVLSGQGQHVHQLGRLRERCLDRGQRALECSGTREERGVASAPLALGSRCFGSGCTRPHPTTWAPERRCRRAR